MATKKRFSKEQIEEIKFALIVTNGDKVALAQYKEHLSEKWDKTLAAINSKFWDIITNHGEALLKKKRKLPVNNGEVDPNDLPLPESNTVPVPEDSFHHYEEEITPIKTAPEPEEVIVENSGEGKLDIVPADSLINMGRYNVDQGLIDKLKKEEEIEAAKAIEVAKNSVSIRKSLTLEEGQPVLHITIDLNINLINGK